MIFNGTTITFGNFYYGQLDNHVHRLQTKFCKRFIAQFNNKLFIELIGLISHKLYNIGNSARRRIDGPLGGLISGNVVFGFLVAFMICLIRSFILRLPLILIDMQIFYFAPPRDFVTNSTINLAAIILNNLNNNFDYLIQLGQWYSKSYLDNLTPSSTTILVANFGGSMADSTVMDVGTFSMQYMNNFTSVGIDNLTTKPTINSIMD